MKHVGVLGLFLIAAVGVSVGAVQNTATRAATANLGNGQRVTVGLTLPYLGGRNGASAGPALNALDAEALEPGQGRGNPHGRGNGEERSNEHGQGRGHERGGPREHGRGGRRLRAAFSSHEQYLIRRYFRNAGSNLPPGLAKRGGNLPPGLERHLEKYGTLPPGLQKRLEPFPPALARELPPLPAGCGCRRVILGDRALIIDTANRILDIFLYR